MRDLTVEETAEVITIVLQMQNACEDRNGAIILTATAVFLEETLNRMHLTREQIAEIYDSLREQHCIPSEDDEEGRVS